MESIRKYYRMDRRQIHFFKFLLEAYEGVAVLTTLDRTTGLVVLLIAPGREVEAAQLVEQLSKEIMIEPVTDAHRSVLN